MIGEYSFSFSKAYYFEDVIICGADNLLLLSNIIFKHLCFRVTIAKLMMVTLKARASRIYPEKHDRRGIFEDSLNFLGDHLTAQVSASLLALG